MLKSASTDTARRTRPSRMRDVLPIGVPGAAGPRGTEAVAAPERRRRPRVLAPDQEAGLTYLARSALTGVPLVLSDLLALLVAVATTEMLFPGVVSVGGSPVVFFLLLSAGLITVNSFNGLYPGIGLHGVVELRKSTTAIALLFLALFLAELLRWDGWAFSSRLVVIGALGSVLVPLARAGTRRLCGRFGWWRHRIAVFGAGASSRRIAEYFASNPALGLTPVSVHDAQTELDPEWRGTSAADRARVAVSLGQASRATYAALPLGENGRADEEYLIRQCANAFPRVLLVPAAGRLPTLWADATDVGGILGIETGTNLLRPFPQLVKRAMDLGLASLIGLLILPFVVVIALAIKLTSPGPVFYGQMRIGRGRRTFRAWKFRTMRVDADEVLAKVLAANPDLRDEWERTHKLRHDPRITGIGQILRKTSLDELPQIWNVLRGDMSLVGPRPVVEAEAAKYAQGFGPYLCVRPGITGLWQVSGRNRTTYAERVRLDEYYVDNWSPWLDLNILARTVYAVLTGDGAC